MEWLTRLLDDYGGIATSVLLGALVLIVFVATADRAGRDPSSKPRGKGARRHDGSGDGTGAGGS